MRYDFLIDTYRTERVKVLSVWSMLHDDDFDRRTGVAEVFSVKKGRFNTDAEGLAEFDFEIPAPIFADGFESGDVSAWSYTRADFSKNQPKRRGTSGGFARGARNN